MEQIKGRLKTGGYRTELVNEAGFKLAMVGVGNTLILDGYEEKLGIPHWADRPGESFVEISDEEAHEVAKRLIACWNACHGVRTEDLESVGVHFGDAYMKAAALAHTMTEERDELKTRLDVVEAAAREALEWLKDPAMRDRMPAPLVDNLLGALGGAA